MPVFYFGPDSHLFEIPFVREGTVERAIGANILHFINEDLINAEIDLIIVGYITA